MKITPGNIGNIIRMDLRQEHVLIEAVTDDLVFFRKETGDRYSTFDHEIAGSVLLDETRIEEFHRNAKLGAALHHAEYQAFCSLLRSDLTHEQHVDANAVLETVRNMRKHLISRIMEQNQVDAVKQHRSLDVLIFRASGNAHAQQTQNICTTQFQFGSER